jgi:hypothetical protein
MTLLSCRSGSRPSGLAAASSRDLSEIRAPLRDNIYAASILTWSLQACSRQFEPVASGSCHMFCNSPMGWSACWQVDTPSSYLLRVTMQLLLWMRRDKLYFERHAPQHKDGEPQPVGRDGITHAKCLDGNFGCRKCATACASALLSSFSLYCDGFSARSMRDCICLGGYADTAPSVHQVVNHSTYLHSRQLACHLQAGPLSAPMRLLNLHHFGCGAITHWAAWGCFNATLES